MTRVNFPVERWTRRSAVTVCVLGAVLAVLAAGAALFPPLALDDLVTLFVYVIIGVTWNALAGYGGLVSVGQQAFFGLGAYAAIRLSASGMEVYAALVLGAVCAALVAWIVSPFMLRLRDSEFAIGMWVLAQLFLLLVGLDPMIQGVTGTSLLALEHFPRAARRVDTYLLALAAMSLLLIALFLLLRSGLGAAMQAIRDDEGAAASVGVNVGRAKRAIFVFAAFGAGIGGTLWLAVSISFQPQAYFGVQWTAYMIFITLVGGIGTVEGPVIGAVIFFAIDTVFGAGGVWYLIGLGAAAVGFALLAPAGIWGAVERRFEPGLLPVGHILRLGATAAGAPSLRSSTPKTEGGR